MTPHAVRPLLLTDPTTPAGLVARSCTEGDAHAEHRWTDGRRTWACGGRGGRERLADLVELSLAG